MRLDQYLFAQNLFSSREKAHAAVMSGVVYVNGEKADKPGAPVKDGAAVEVRGGDNPYVSRGGLKLEKALTVFGCSPAGSVCMDIGASTGGFTDCLLQNGAAKVYAVDVGYGQLDWALRGDARVVVMERTNARNLQPCDVADAIEFFTVDVSFISLSLILPAVRKLAAARCEGVCLVKPQFEAGRENVGKNGVVTNAAVHREVLQKACRIAGDNGFSVAGVSFSPVKGPKGNIEFLLHVRLGAAAAGTAEPEGLVGTIETVVRQAHEQL